MVHATAAVAFTEERETPVTVTTLEASGRACTLQTLPIAQAQAAASRLRRLRDKRSWRRYRLGQVAAGREMRLVFCWEAARREQAIWLVSEYGFAPRRRAHVRWEVLCLQNGRKPKVAHVLRGPEGNLERITDQHLAQDMVTVSQAYHGAHHRIHLGELSVDAFDVDGWGTLEDA